MSTMQIEKLQVSPRGTAWAIKESNGSYLGEYYSLTFKAKCFHTWAKKKHAQRFIDILKSRKTFQHLVPGGYVEWAT